MNRKKIKYTDFVQNTSLFFALVIAFWIPSYRWILSYFIVGWGVFSILEMNFKQRMRRNLKSKISIVLLSFQLLLFLFFIVNLFYADNKDIVLKQIIQKLSLLIFPLFFVLTGSNFKEKKLTFLKLFVLSNFIMSIICIGVATYHAFSFGDNGSLIYNHAIYGRSFFRQSQLSVFHHRGYFSMYLVFAIVILFYFAEKQKIFNTNAKKIFYWLLLAFFVLMIFLLTSRAGILSLFILFSWQLIRKIFFSDKIIYKLSVIPVIIFMAFVVLKNDRIKKTVYVVFETENTENSASYQKIPARIGLWKAAIDIIPENLLFGTGIENFQDIFDKAYSHYSYKDISFIKNQRLNVHNQFLEIFVKYGIFAFLIFLSLFIYPIIVAFKRKNYLFFAFLLITSFNFLFESMIDTIAGIVFFSFFMNYFIFVFHEE